MLHASSRAFFNRLAGSSTIKRLASRYGMKQPGGFARRFVAGETLEEAIVTARAVEQRGMTTTLNYLGERVQSAAAAQAATREYLAVLETVLAAGISRNLSVKLTQLGLETDRAACTANLKHVLDAAQRAQCFTRIDMENSTCTDATLDILEAMWHDGYRNVGVVLQSYLYRSESDVRRVNRLGASIRLVKGAYMEPKTIAYQKKADVDASFVRLMRVLLTENVYPAIATHDRRMIDATCAFAAERGLPPDGFEFQLLYGVRRDLQAAVRAMGSRLRIYLPFGREWFPYFMRRLGERPANVLFVVRSLSER
jgi:proline dehydrogenase